MQFGLRGPAIILGFLQPFNTSNLARMGRPIGYSTIAIQSEIQTGTAAGQD